VSDPELPTGVRRATADDVPAIHTLICDLASYERARDQVRATPDQLRAALFAPHPAVHALVAQAAGTVESTGSAGAVDGFALYFLSYSTWEGVHGIYLEDLYVRPERRGHGLGKALLTALATIAVARGYARVEWSVLDWNEPSIAFYRRFGATPKDEWTTFRLTGDALVAATHPGPTT
jgi:GNAT superfamily N-acetyltransferase